MTNTIRVRNEIQRQLMLACIIPAFQPGGKWSGKSQANLVKPWLDLKVVVDPENVGRDFEAQKTNWNVNDSNWVNPNWAMFAEAARKGNKGKEMGKKAILFELVDLKVAVFATRARDVQAAPKPQKAPKASKTPKASKPSKDVQTLPAAAPETGAPAELEATQKAA